MSGSQIQPLDWRGVRPWAKAATRLTAKNSVPTNSTKALSQSRRRGRKPHHRIRSSLSALLASRIET